MIHNCDLCGNADKFLPVPGDPSGKISICGQCGFVVVRERRSLAEVAQAWSTIYRSGGYDPEWPGVKARLFYVAEWLDQTIGLHGKSVLDIGAGNGQFMEYVADRSGNPFGLDPDSKNVDAITSRKCTMPALKGWASDDGPYVGEFDIVTLNWTLENVGSALEVLRYAQRCLAPNGCIVVSTGSRIGVPFKKRLSRYLPQSPAYPHDTHCYRWSHLSLMQAFESIGMIRKETNDWRDRDELIMVAFSEPHLPVKSEGNPKIAEWVHKHFSDWYKMFP